MSSKSRTVKSILEADKRIVVVRVVKNNYFPHKSGYFSHTYAYYVAPVNPVYDSEKLQKLMMDLIPEIAPTQKDDFRQGGGSMSYGKLYFDEEIGRMQSESKIVITLTDEDFIATSEGCHDGIKVIESKTDEPLNRRTWVQLYPNTLLAAEASKGKDEFSIDASLLRRYASLM